MTHVDGSTTLLPCPFCGGEDIKLWDGLGTQADIHCAACCCSRDIQVIDLFDGPTLDRPLLDGDLRYPADLVERAKQYLISAWNTRAALQSQPTGETWQTLSCNAQFDLAQRIAANVGYALAPEPSHPDSPHAPPPSPDRLLALIRERDDFIVDRGLWLDFVGWLEDRNRLSRQPEASENNGRTPKTASDPTCWTDTEREWYVAGFNASQKANEIRKPEASEPVAWPGDRVVPPTQTELRKLVDVVWNECSKNTAVPSFKFADQMIGRVFASPVLPDREGEKQP